MEERELVVGVLLVVPDQTDSDGVFPEQKE